MFRFLCKTQRHVRFTARDFLQIPSSSLRSISTSTNQHSFTVSYLMNSCGFSPESALSASQYLHFETPEKPDSVLAFFKNHGFTETQITKVIKRVPTIIVADPEKTLLPKLDFLYSIGLSSTDLAKTLAKNSIVLRRSLKNQIIPSFNFFKSLLHDNVKIIAAFKRFPEIFAHGFETTTAPNVAILQEFGVPKSNIASLLTSQPQAFVTRPDLFRDNVEKAKGLGFDPLRMNFLSAVFTMRSMSKSTWERKVEVYRKWNLTEKEILVAFRKNTRCMTNSEGRIMAMTDYFVNTMGWEASTVAHRPELLSLSLENRIVPRCSVVQVLLSKGLIKKGFSLRTLLEAPEKVFLKKFVTCYNEEAPQLLKLYQEKLDLSRVGSGNILLWEAILGGDEPVIKLHQEVVQKYSGDVGQFACTAAELNSLNLLEEIVRYGGDVTSPVSNETTALHVAVCEGNTGMVKIPFGSRC